MIANPARRRLGGVRSRCSGTFWPRLGVTPTAVDTRSDVALRCAVADLHEDGGMGCVGVPPENLKALEETEDSEELRAIVERIILADRDGNSSVSRRRKSGSRSRVSARTYRAAHCRSSA